MPEVRRVPPVERLRADLNSQGFILCRLEEAVFDMRRDVDMLITQQRKMQSRLLKLSKKVFQEEGIESE